MRFVLPPVGCRSNENNEKLQLHKPVFVIWARDLANSEWHPSDRDIRRISANVCCWRSSFVFFTDYYPSIYPTPGIRQQEDRQLEEGARQGQGPKTAHSAVHEKDLPYSDSKVVLILVNKY
jgi:hypothetical protein